jgi:GxxExxY protein
MNQTYVNEAYERSDATAKIIACAVEVHKTLGPGFQEVFYQRALHRELTWAGIEAEREVDIEVRYKDLTLGKKRIDFVVGDCMVEIKAKAALEEVDFIQTLSYLKASGYPIGLLISFGGAKIEIKRLANTKPRHAQQALD